MVRGVVLCGGASRRMGRDKALIGDPPWAHRVAATLAAAGCEPVLLLGGDTRLGNGPWRHLGDAVPSAGPGAALLQACRLAGDSPLIVAACDLPGLDQHHVHVLSEHLGRGEPAAAYRVGGRAQWSLVAVSGALAVELAARAPGDGPSLNQLLCSTTVLHEPDDPARVRDLDAPGDLSDGASGDVGDGPTG